MLATSRVFLRDFWTLTKPYWASDERWRSGALLAVIVGMQLGLVAINVWYADWRKLFYQLAAEQGHRILYPPDYPLRLHRSLIHCRRGLSELPAANASNPLAAVADGAVHRALDGAPGLLSAANRVRWHRQPGSAHRRGRQFLHCEYAQSRLGLPQCGRDPGVVHGAPMGPLGRAHYRRHRDSWLHVLGRAGLRHRRIMDHELFGPALDPAEFHAAALRGEFPLFAGPAARECRRCRALWRRISGVRAASLAASPT